MHYSNILESWLMSCIIAWIFFAEKPKETTPSTIGASLCSLILMPLWFVIFIPLFYSDRKKLKWIRKKWFCIALRRIMDYSFGWRHSYNLKGYDLKKMEMNPSNEVHQPFVYLPISDNSTIGINGVTFSDEEEIEIKYLCDRWQSATMVYKSSMPWVGWDPGWYIRDASYDYRKVDFMKAIRKINKK